MNTRQLLRNSEDRRELGLSLLTIGFMLWVFDLLVVFFLPAAYRTGHHRPFLILIGSAAIAGLVLLAIGFRMRVQR